MIPGQITRSCILQLRPGTAKYINIFKKFLRDKSTRTISCSIEVTLVGLLGGYWVRGQSPERPSHDQELGIFSPTPSSSRNGRGAENEVNN